MLAEPAQRHRQTSANSRVEDEDSLIFGDFCFTCGNATQGTPYCSRECRITDSEQRGLISPDFSPALSAVPPLVSSAKSSTSSPPSSNNSSPSPLTGLMGEMRLLDGEDPPRLDLSAAPEHMLSSTLRYPSGYSLSYAQEQQMAFPAKELKSALSSLSSTTDDLKYLRRPGAKPSQTVPAPLYFRQAAAHHSPALLPTSPSRSHFSPRTSPNRPPSLTNVSAFVLPPPVSTVPSLPPSPTFSPVGSPNNRRSSWAPSSAATTMARRFSKEGAADLLLSPRIHALRAEDGAPHISEDVEEPDAGNSAFARFLFSHLDTTADDANSSTVSLRGRQEGPPPPVAIEPKRSVSADSVLPLRTPSLGKARRGRFMFSRGSGANGDADEDVDDADEDEPTPMPAKALKKLVPGHFINATSDSPLSSAAPSTSTSPSSSPPPPAARGRSTTRRLSDADEDVPLADGRGRSKLRGLGAVERSMSPHREASGSRGRLSAEPSRERGRRFATEESEDRSRGRGSRRREEDIEEEDDGEDRGRRGRGTSRSRSTSVLRRGRGRDIAITAVGRD